jgi:formylglycine-generating enzyme required for sulfatase activity
MGKTIFAILSCVCAVIPLAAQTAAPDGMALIPAGKFWMGRVYAYDLYSVDVVARDRYDDVPANHVHLDAFYLDKYEVTNADYAKFLEANHGKAPWHWPEGQVPAGEAAFPVYNVNWYEATDYCKWAGKRLPTEAEWEKALRGGVDRETFAWGDDKFDNAEPQMLPVGPDPKHNAKPVPAAIGRNSAMKVAAFPPNAYGLYDMVGGVTEWTNDWFDPDYYRFMPKANPKGPETGKYRSVRGSNWMNSAAGTAGSEKLRSYFRNFADPEARSTGLGFRCAKAQ